MTAADDSRDERLAFLRRVPLFASLDDDALVELSGLLVEEEHERGTVLCEAGDEGDTFHLVVAGELEVRTPGTARISRLGPGDYFGEVALLLGDRRSATVVVARAARLLTLSSPVFAAAYGRDAHVLEQLSMTLARRLAQQAAGVDDRPQRVIAVRADEGLRGTSLVATALAALIDGDEPDASVLHLRLDRPDRVDAAALPLDRLVDLVATDLVSAVVAGPTARLEVAADRPVDRDQRIALDRALAALRERFPHVVAEIGHVGLDRDEVRDLADETVEIVRTTRPPEPDVLPVLNRWNVGTAEVPLNHTAPFVLRVEPSLVDRPPVAVVDHLRTDPWSPFARTLQRLARTLLGRSVGLALGGGAAFGIAHVGVLACLEQAGVPVDLLVGTSMGSIVAVGSAVGLRADDLAALARRLGGDLRTILSVVDLHPLRPGVISGERIAAIFEPYLGGARCFSDLVVPCRTVATDIETGERVTLDDGLLLDAARASSSIPVLVSPARLGDRYLVDGAMCDPVPAGVAVDMGADVVLAVNVVPQLRKGVTNVLSRVARRVGALNPLGLVTRRGPAPNLLDVTMNAMQTLQYELGQFKAVAADVLVNPDLADFTWIEFYRPDELMQRGYEAAERVLPDIERVLAERARDPRPRRT